MAIKYDIEPLLKLIEQTFNLTIDPQFDQGLVLALENKYRVQIEFLEDRIIISSILGELLPSRYRSQVFEDALRANFKSTCFGTLGYNDRQKFLMLVLTYPKIPLKNKSFFH